MDAESRKTLRMQKAMAQMQAILNEDVLGEGSMSITLTPRQLDYLARVTEGDTSPVALGLRLILDLDERVFAGQMGCEASSGCSTLGREH